MNCKRFLLLFLFAISPLVSAQQGWREGGAGPGGAGGEGRWRDEERMQRREALREQREERRELRREREANYTMSPDERRQLRRDVGNAGNDLYPRHRRP